MARRPGRPPKGPSAAEIYAGLERGRKAFDARAREVQATIDAAMDARARTVHRLGRALATVRAERLYASFGDPSFDAFLARIGVGRSQAWKWMKIAAELTEEEAASLDVEEAYSRATRSKRRVRGRRARAL